MGSNLNRITQKERDFVISNSDLSNRQLAELMNCNIERVKAIKQKFGIKRTNWKIPEEARVIIERYYGKIPASSISKLLLEMYGYEVLASKIRNYAHVHGFDDKEYRNKTQYSLYSEKIVRVAGKSDAVYIKVPCVNNPRKTEWVRKDKYIWENYYTTKLGNDEFLYHLDGDIHNCEIENLRKSNYKKIGRIARILSSSESLEVKETALLYADFVDLINSKRTKMKGDNNG